MAKLILRQEAIDDLTDIWGYSVRVWSEKQADRYYEDIKQACHQVALDPAIGREYTILKPGIFGLRVNKHFIFYQIVESGEVEVIRILHEKMDFQRHIV